VEALQFAFAIGASDITDVITNTAGGAFGVLIYDAIPRRGDGRKLDAFICAAGSVLVILVVWVLLSQRVRFRTHG
jgi:glycopeptide antibiotics resistance protein